MAKPKTWKNKKKYNKRFTNKRKNNKFRHTKKIYKKKRHTTLKHKKIQRGGYDDSSHRMEQGLGRLPDRQPYSNIDHITKLVNAYDPSLNRTYDPEILTTIVDKFKNPLNISNVLSKLKEIDPQFVNNTDDEIKNEITEEIKKYIKNICVNEHSCHIFSKPYFFTTYLSEHSEIKTNFDQLTKFTNKISIFDNYILDIIKLELYKRRIKSITKLYPTHPNLLYNYIFLKQFLPGMSDMTKIIRTPDQYI